MNSFTALGRLLIYTGIFLLVVGLVFLLFSRLGGMNFRIPGDIYIKRENFTLYFPLAACIFISILLTIVLNLISRR